MNDIIYFLDGLTQLKGSNVVCPEDDSIFHCTRDSGSVIDWQITSSCRDQDYRTSFSSSSPVGHTRDATLCATTLMFTVTSLTRSSISVTLTVHTPVLLNGTTVSCMDQMQTLHIYSGR